MFSDRERNLGPKQLSTTVSASMNSLAERYGISNGDRVILYAGTFEPYQGLDLLVDASREVINARKDVRFLCAGGNEKQIAQTKSRARCRGVAEYFIFPGVLAPETVDDLLKIASVLVSPRTSGTNTPLKIYSYLRSGVPILATKILSHTQVLTDQVALLVEPLPEALGAGIIRLLQDDYIGARLAKNALRLAHEAYSEDAYRRKVAEVFSFLAAKSERAS
jgi:glycosyltransferase involved in cell wall biosynthesis